MEDREVNAAAAAAVAAQVSAFYEDHPYPLPADDLDAYRRAWDEQRRRAESHLFWPAEPYREDRSILVAGCGTIQAAHYAIRWPRAQVIGIDVSATSIAFTRELKRKYALANLGVRQLAVEDVAELGITFEHVACTGVLHHLPDPDTGLRALRDVLAPSGALNVMVYAPYGRAGVYMLQDYCRRLGIGATAPEIRDLAASLKALPPDHALAPLLRKSPDFASESGIADALLHPRDRAYSVPQLMDFLRRSDLTFGRWVRQAPYLPWCGAFASAPHHAKLVALSSEAQYAALELFRGTMVRHSLVAYRNDRPAQKASVCFEGDAWLDYTPIRLSDTLTVREKLPPGDTAVLINRNHTYTDLYLPIDAPRDRLLAAIDERRTIAEICGERGDRELARVFFEQLWRWDQVVFDTSPTRN
ncbi:MAG TPA: class I SAM-dependent methyltransferase [Candidatus Baltobacteraceae bacterium]|nr:class I SAM-dependent methyltransferase [Candidatus Baltobacteraceae bacterium]